MHEPFVEAKVKQTPVGDFILEIGGPYDVETYIQGHNRQELIDHLRPCEEDRSHGESIENVMCSVRSGWTMKVEVRDHYAHARFKHEQAMEVLNG